MKELQELRNEVLSLRNMGEITKQTESILLHKLNALKAAINYTHSCKSDSELLKDKPKLNFEDWYITYGYAKSFTGNFVKEGIRYTADQMQFKYEYNMP